MENIPAVASDPNFLINAEFVKLTIYNSTEAALVSSGDSCQIQVTGTTNWTAIGAASNVVGTTFTANATGSGNGYAYVLTTHTFSSAYREETFGGYAYNPLGGLLAVGIQQRDLRVTSADTTISLSGISGNNMQLVLDNTIKGSTVEIYRGFYSNNYVLDTANVAKRFTGVVTSYNITEDRQDQDDNFTVTVSCSSFKTTLENRIAGRKTNMQSWQVFNSTDSSMNNVYSIAGQSFDFGKKPSPKSSNPSGASTDQQVSTDNYVTEQGGP